MVAQADIVEDDDINHAHDVFISYAHRDEKTNAPFPDQLTARRLGTWLEEEGYDVWWDRDLLFGDVQQQLEKKASHAKCVIALWSPNADASHNVTFECQLAANRGTLAVLVIDACPLRQGWDRFLWVDMTDFEEQKADILRKLPPPSGKRPSLIIPETERISLAGLPTPARTFIGREDELEKLTTAWASTTPGADAASKTNIFVLHAIGGAGKSATVHQFLDMLASRQFDGAHKVYAWSAYSQGSGDNRAASADEFIAKALAFFGHDLMRNPIQDTVDRGRKLAALVGASRSLLILDGLEPLQDAPHINDGRLKDRGLAALIKGLADLNNGLLIITSRQELPELPARHEPRIISDELNQMGIEAGVKLLAALGVDGKRGEMERAVEEVLGHALSLNLLGAYLSAAHGGDINGREQFHLGEIEDSQADFIGDATARYAKRAARIMEGTVARLGAAETAILHMVGLFDRPAEREALEALLAEPAIAGLTDVFQALPPAQRKARWNVAVARLRKLKLIAAEDRHQPGALDAHPIVRAHFGDRLKAKASKAYAQAHSRLYDCYRYQGLPPAFRTPEAYGLLALLTVQREHQDMIVGQIGEAHWPDGWLAEIPPSLLASDWPKLQEAAALIGTAAFDAALTAFLPGGLDEMRPCFAAIAHGCAAKRHQEAFDEVYSPRVLRGNEKFIVHKLGALNADLAALAHFFDALWSTPAAGLREETKARLLNYAAFALQALGRLREAVEPMEAGLKADVAARDWENAAIAAGNVSELRLTLGDIAEAIRAAGDSITHADESGDAFQRMGNRTTLADALHQGGEAAKALAGFVEAEAMQAEMQPHLPRLTSLGGHRYCDLLLAMGQSQAAIERASDAIRVAERNNWLLSIALDHLTLGRAHAMLALDSAQADRTHAAQARTHLDAAVDGLRRAGTEDHLPRALLARATFRRSQGDFPAAADLAEALDIASRGGMRLYLTDYHLESARLALAQFATTGDAGFRTLAEAHHSEAAKLIAATGYKRRLAECDAIRACLDGAIPASLLAPDRDKEGRPIWHDLALPERREEEPAPTHTANPSRNAPCPCRSGKRYKYCCGQLA